MAFMQKNPILWFWGRISVSFAAAISWYWQTWQTRSPGGPLSQTYSAGCLHLVHPVKTFKLAHIPHNFQKTSLLEDESIRRANIASPILLAFSLHTFTTKTTFEKSCFSTTFTCSVFLGNFCEFVRCFPWRNLRKATCFTSNSPKTPYHRMGSCHLPKVKQNIQNSPTPRVFLWFCVKSQSKSFCFINHFFVKTFMLFVGWNFYSWMIW